MKRLFFVQILICVAASGALLYTYIDTQNTLASKRIHLPELTREVKVLKEENEGLLLEIQRFEDPKHLIRLLSDKKYAYLKSPIYQDTLSIQEGLALDVNRAVEGLTIHKDPTILATK